MKQKRTRSIVRETKKKKTNGDEGAVWDTRFVGERQLRRDLLPRGRGDAVKIGIVRPLSLPTLSLSRSHGSRRPAKKKKKKKSLGTKEYFFVV
jgi:hypothetical protein